MLPVLSSLPLSLSDVPTIVACLVLLIVLYRKRHTFTVRDIVVGVFVAVLVFLLLSGTLNRLHVPDMTMHLLGSK